MQVAPELHTNAPFSHIQFSADGKLMLCVAEGHVYQLDAFNGSLQQTYNTGIPPGALGLSAIFSPDSNYILSGLFLLLAVFLADAVELGFCSSDSKLTAAADAFSVLRLLTTPTCLGFTWRI